MLRKHVPEQSERMVLVASRRRCCLCYFLAGDHSEKRGQIAHLNQRSDDPRFQNLVWLCLDYHAAYDGTSRQSKGYTRGEILEYRERLYTAFGESQAVAELLRASGSTPEKESAVVTAPTGNEWRYPLWQVANQPALFAYKSRLGADGVCLIERVDLPDGRIVVACVSAPGNPGTSITNTVESICSQVCDRFRIPPERLVWLEHYPGDADWRWVVFRAVPPAAPFGEPEWVWMTDELWADLRLSPADPPSQFTGGVPPSWIDKHFDWPTRGLDNPT